MRLETLSDQSGRDMIVATDSDTPLLPRHGRVFVDARFCADAKAPTQRTLAVNNVRAHRTVLSKPIANKARAVLAGPYIVHAKYVPNKVLYSTLSGVWQQSRQTNHVLVHKNRDWHDEQICATILSDAS